MKKRLSLIATLLSAHILTLSLCADTPASPTKPALPQRIAIIGDSTVCNYPTTRPDRGWGMFIEEYFQRGAVTVINTAAAGRSTKTFISEGRWKKTLAEKPDYVLIQFGHNDSHAPDKPESTNAATDFKDYLRRYIDEARAIGATPILVTPMVRRLFATDGKKLKNELQRYADAIKAVAAEKNTALIDLHTASKTLVEKLGPAVAAEFANKKGDSTHFNEKGARAMAEIVMKELPAVAPKLAPLLKTSSATAAIPPQKITLTIRNDAPEKTISPDLFGIFFEDINYAADGGLYAELIQNRSFEYNALEQPTWNQLSFWELTKRNGGEGRIALEAARPLHPNNPHYLVLDVTKISANANTDVTSAVGITNPGFDGIAVKAGETYDLSLFTRQLFMNRRWPPNNTIEDRPMPLVARLETKDGDVLCETTLEVTGREWTRLTATLTPARTADDARFVLLAKAAGGIALDEISLFPRNTFHNRPNGLRADLAQIIADMQPRFIRFPGGCLAHGDGLGNIYRWKDTIGPIEQRRGQPNLWRYHQSVGLGYYEYFQFCEDIGAKPLPVLASAVSCQNSDYNGETGQQLLPLEDMPAYIQDVLDLIEWANGPATSTWGAKRAAAGHPAPFNLEYIGIGNEDIISPGFKERFKMIHDAIRAKHPEITVIGTVGPAPDDKDFFEGWRFAKEQKVSMVDEHYYRSPQWFLNNLHRYDSYERNNTKVYVGEYAAHDTGRKSTLRSALAEAAYMTQLERNGDIVHLISYAPLLAKIGRTQWTPDLIYFTNTAVYPTINYHVQKLFGQNAGDRYIETTSTHPDAIVTSTVRDSKTGDLILKLVNPDPAAKLLTIKLPNAKSLSATATKTVLTGDPLSENTQTTKTPLLPEVAQITIAETITCEAPANSLTIIRLKK